MIESFPAHPLSALATAEAAFRCGDNERAVNLLLSSLAVPECAVRLREWAVAERRMDVLQHVFSVLNSGTEAEAAISRAIAQQLRGDVGAALATLQAVLQSDRTSATAQHHRARALQNLGRSDEAAAAVERALALAPNYAEAWYSRAHIERARGRLEPALAAYRAALELMPALRPALLNLGITLCALEQPQAALQPLDRLLELDPDSVDALINKGLCLHILGRMDEAQCCYRHALELAPTHPLAHFYLGCLCNEQMQTEPARQHLEAALAAAPGDPDTLTELVGLLEQTNDLPTAAARVHEGLAIAPRHAGLNLEAARLARRAGRIDEARERMLAVDARALPARLAQQYWFERGQLHDRAKEPAAAMQAFETGNALAARSPRRARIDTRAFPLYCIEIADWLAAGASGARATHADPLPESRFRPAFLVGFPRSGTTLLDTMLDAHPEVASIEERATIEVVVDEVLAASGGYPRAMPHLTHDTLRIAHAVYARALRPLLPENFSGCVLDKLPLRMLRVPLIRRLYPQAPILFAVRHPCDVVLSNFMQQYVPNEAFVHFDTIADSARIYDQIMRLWRQILDTLSIQAHWVRYESLVADPGTELAGAAAALGIDVRDGMLDHAQRMQGRERIQTNSYQQVAEPIYQRAAGRWQQYRPWLEPVLPMLRPHLEWLGYSD